MAAGDFPCFPWNIFFHCSEGFLCCTKVDEEQMLKNHCNTLCRRLMTNVHVLSLLNNLAFNRKILKNESRQNASKIAIFFPEMFKAINELWCIIQPADGKIQITEPACRKQREPKVQPRKKTVGSSGPRDAHLGSNSFLRWMQVSHNDGEYFWVVLWSWMITHALKSWSPTDLKCNLAFLAITSLTRCPPDVWVYHCCESQC